MEGERERENKDKQCVCASVCMYIIYSYTGTCICLFIYPVYLFVYVFIYICVCPCVRMCAVHVVSETSVVALVVGVTLVADEVAWRTDFVRASTMQSLLHCSSILFEWWLPCSMNCCFYCHPYLPPSKAPGRIRRRVFDGPLHFVPRPM